MKDNFDDYSTVWIIGQFELILYKGRYGIEYYLVNMSLPLAHSEYITCVGRL